MDLEQTKHLIVTEVQKHWSRTGRALLIAQLGSRLGANTRTEIEADTGLKLQAFIRTNMTDDLLIHPNPRSPDILGLFPRDAQLAEDLSFYFQPAGQPAAKRYRPSFWAAFAKPIAPNYRRYIRPDDLFFVDLPQTAPAPVNTLEITRDAVPPEDADGRDQLIIQSISKWLAQTSLPEQSVLLGAHTDSRIATEQTSHNLLFSILSHLDDAELKRITLPMDIVRKLARAKV
jgi:hypothetical protein